MKFIKSRKACVVGLCFSMVGWAESIPIDDFSIDATEVTVAEYRDFAQRTGYVTHAEKTGGGYEWGAGWEQRKGWNYLHPYGKPAAPDEPASHINYFDALAYCRSKDGDLPSMKQWALAAYTESRDNPPSGFIKNKTYPYSSGETDEKLNVLGEKDGYARQAPVKALPPGVNGLYQMGGNLWEWGKDQEGGQRITMGGSWWYGSYKSMAGGFQYKDPTFAAVYIGFRCVYKKK